MATLRANTCTSQFCVLPPLAALPGRRGVGAQLSTPQATAAAMERVTRRKGYASAAGPHPCARVGGVFSPPPGAVASGSGWRGGLPAAAVASIGSGLE
jgi:hypothetical protein